MTQPHSFPVYAFTNSHSVVVTILLRVRREGKKFKKKKIAKMSFYLVSCWKCLIAMSGVSELCTAALQRCYFCGCLCLSECPRKCLEAAVSLVRTREWEQAARSVSNIDCRGAEQRVRPRREPRAQDHSPLPWHRGALGRAALLDLLRHINMLGLFSAESSNQDKTETTPRVIYLLETNSSIMLCVCNCGCKAVPSLDNT